MKTPVNSFSVYLIKEEYTDHASIIKSCDSLNSKDIEDIGTFYFGESFKYAPSWQKKFFNDALDDVDIFNASSKAIILIEVNVKKNKKRIFALPFGYGWTMLNPGSYEERFGLKTTLSIIESDGLRKISKKNMSSVPKDTSEQLSKAGIVADFEIDIEQDLIQSITGRTKHEEFGRTVSGKDSLSVSTRVNITNIKDFLKSSYDKYISKDYEKNFGWIDQLSEIKDRELKEQLDNQLVENIKQKSLDKTWMAVPEIVDWVDVAGFRYKGGKDDDLPDDIGLLDFLDSLSDDDRNNLTVDVLKRRNINCISKSSDEIKYHWKAYNCIYCEIADSTKRKIYLLSNGKWYEIENNFAEQINQSYMELRNAGSSLSLPHYNHKNENDYNASIAKKDKSYCCMDGKNISHGGGYSKIEFCDLMTNDNKLIHIKRYAGSSVLSHLFAQGSVSGELFLGDADFRKKVNTKLSATHKFKDTTIKPNPQDYEIIFGIISTSPKELDIPFFSKVSLRNAWRRLQIFGYKVSLLKISTDKEYIKRKSK